MDADEQGRMTLVGLWGGYREREQSWQALLRALLQQGTTMDMIRLLLLTKTRRSPQFLYANSQHAEWSAMTLAHLAARYEADEVEYTMDDLKQ